MAKRAKIASLAILWGGKIRIFAVLSCINAFKYMSKSANYESPLTEIISMPLEGVICGSVPDAGGMNFENPFGGNTEEEWL